MDDVCDCVIKVLQTKPGLRQATIIRVTRYRLGCGENVVFRAIKLLVSEGHAVERGKKLWGGYQFYAVGGYVPRAGRAWDGEDEHPIVRRFVPAIQFEKENTCLINSIL